MQKIKIEKIEKDILDKLIKKISEVKGKDYKIVYEEYVIRLYYEYKDTMYFVHSFMNNDYENNAVKSAFYYLKGAIEN